MQPMEAPLYKKFIPQEIGYYTKYLLQKNYLYLVLWKRHRVGTELA